MNGTRGLRNLRRTILGTENMRTRAALRHGVAFVCVVALALVSLRSLVGNLGAAVTGPGDPLLTAWRLAWPAQWLAQQPAPFWETNVLYPARDVLARDELTLGQSLLAAPFYLLTGNAILAHNATLLATLALSGFAMYYLAWYLFHTFTGSLLAGIVYAFAPYHIAQREHAGLLAIQWLPLALLFLHRTLRYRRPVDAVCFALAVFLQAIAAGYYAYWTLLVVLIFMGYVVLAERRLISARGFAYAGGALAVALAALVPVLLPFARVAASAGFARARQEVEFWSARPQSWLAATPDNLLYGPLVRRFAWTWSTELFLFPGAVALGLALYGLIAWRGRLRWFGLALVVAGFVLSLGPTLHLGRQGGGIIPLPYDLFYRFVPGGDALRAPLRVAPLAMLGLALLVAAGWERLTLALLLRDTARRATRLASLTLSGLLVLEYLTAAPPTHAVPQLDRAPGTVAAWLAQEPPRTVAVLPDVRAPVTMALATVGRHRFINGDAEILPPATAALFNRLRAFPAPESVAALQALDVNTVVLLRDGYTEGAWRDVNARLSLPLSSLQPRATLENGAVFGIEPDRGVYASLRAVVPAGASIFIAGAAPGDPALLDRALVSHALRDRRVYGDLRTGWTSEPKPPPVCPRYDYGVFTQTDPVAPDRYDAAPIWSDGMVSVYRAKPAAAGACG